MLPTVSGSTSHFQSRNEAMFLKSQPIVAQCLGGGRSAIATSILQRAGYNVTNMQGGYNAWVEARLPIAI